ncbi:transposase [Nitrosomonas sp. Nm58]
MGWYLAWWTQSDEAVEDMANVNLHVMRFLGLNLEDDVSDHSSVMS